MNYLITGGAGFIGSHLSETLLQEGHSVTVIDDLSTGNTENLRDFVSNSQFRFVLGNIRDSHDLGTLMAWADTVFHLAAAVGVDLVVREPVRTIETNVHGTERVLKYAAATSVKVMLASTSEVYGKAATSTFNEEDDLLIGPPTHYRWSYAASKALDEYLAFAYAKEKKLRMTVARFFNTVGPRQTGRYGMVLPRFVRQALQGEPLRVFGDGKQTRCFCYVKDTIRALIALETAAEAENRIFNIGTTQPISINALAEKVITLTESKSSIKHIPYREAYGPGFEDMRRRIPDTARVTKLTGWIPRMNLDQIILEVKKYIEDERIP